ncbi:MAG: anaerobic glycerol-3-phosphate dehydrogenase subunit A [Tannerellaceae bacterium]|jgi:glycerol-3-phosphate dehydrogenase|nr:anaerobic glycerol-3-phosphate dehydrogenase subunit A [Tannerellaceae bacterium]
MTHQHFSPYDVIIIGGGATGAGIARDCSLRGLSVLVVERSDIATGATGRNHGLLHSGARYAVTDRESAVECIQENNILKNIASHCVEKTEGLFLSLPEDDLSYQSKFVQSCRDAGISAEIIDPGEALLMEPAANKEIIGAVKVPDGSIDPFRLTLSNSIDAQTHGGKLLTYHEVTDLIINQHTVIGVKAYDFKTKETKYLYANIVVNAAGIWGQHISTYADIKINMFPAKGSLLIFGHRINRFVLNRCRKPADADILVPGDTICLIGTTSIHVPYNEIDNMYVTPDEVDKLIHEGEKLSPILAHTRILRAYAGVRPLVAADDDPTGRNISRGIVLLDHQKRDGLSGYITITGGKLMTYRLMAEMATDLICKKLNIDAICVTATTKLPGSNEKTKEVSTKMYTVPASIRESAIYRHGEMAQDIPNATSISNSLVCECEEVSAGEVHYAKENLNVNNLTDLRRRTRVGMGTCQGALCACRAVGLINQLKKEKNSAQSKEDLSQFLNERWKGIYPISWGDSLRESEYTSWVYESVCGLNSPENTQAI